MVFPSCVQSIPQLRKKKKKESPWRQIKGGVSGDERLRQVNHQPQRIDPCARDAARSALPSASHGSKTAPPYGVQQHSTSVTVACRPPTANMQARRGTRPAVSAVPIQGVRRAVTPPPLHHTTIFFSLPCCPC